MAWKTRILMVELGFREFRALAGEQERSECLWTSLYSRSLQKSYAMIRVLQAPGRRWIHHWTNLHSG